MDKIEYREEPQDRISRRNLLIGLATVVGTGMGLASCVQFPMVSSPVPTPTTPPTPMPTATPIPSPTPIPPRGTAFYSYQGHAAEVTSLAWSPNGAYLASAGEDHVQVWDTATGGKQSLYTLPNPSRAVAWSPNGKQIASLMSDRYNTGTTAQVWDAPTGGNLATYGSYTKYGLVDVVWSHDGTRIAVAGRTIDIWEVATKKQLASFGSAFFGLGAISWSPDDQRIVSCDQDVPGIVKVYDVRSGKLVYACYGHSEVVHTVSWSPDGQFLASGSGDQTARLWSASNGGLVRIYRGHCADVLSLAWSPDSKQLASASTDDTVQIWDVATANRLFTYGAASRSCGTIYKLAEAVAWSPDGMRIASAEDSSSVFSPATVHVWQAV